MTSKRVSAPHSNGANASVRCSEKSLQRLSLDDGENMRISKKGKILQILPRGEQKKECFCGNRHVSPSSLERTNTNTNPSKTKNCTNRLKPSDKAGGLNVSPPPVNAWGLKNRHVPDKGISLPQIMKEEKIEQLQKRDEEAYNRSCTINQSCKTNPWKTSEGTSGAHLAPRPTDDRGLANQNLQDNDNSLDQIMREEKIKRKQPKPNTNQSEIDNRLSEIIAEHAIVIRSSMDVWGFGHKPDVEWDEPISANFFEIWKPSKNKNLQEIEHPTSKESTKEQKIEQGQLKRQSKENCRTKTPPKRVVQNVRFIQELMAGFSIYIPFNPVEKPYRLEDQRLEELSIIKIQFKETMWSQVTSVQKIVNPFLLLHYSLNEDGLAEELLYHGTNNENVDSICTNNFDWRLVVHHKYGKGVSFSRTPYYASHYCDKSSSEKVMFAVKVSIKWAQIYDDYNSTDVPKRPFDTTTDAKSQVYVKYDDCCFYPQYLIRFTTKD